MKSLKSFYKFNRHYSLVLFSFATLFMFSACQKENFSEIVQQEKYEIVSHDKTTPVVPPDLEGAQALTIDHRTKDQVATARGPISATTLEYHQTFTVNQGDWLNLYYPKNQLPDPDVYKLEVEIVPLSGDPDLYIYGLDTDSLVSSYIPFRFIRKSINGGLNTDRTSFRLTDMLSDEDELYINVYGFQKSQYEIYIYKTTISCQEYPPAYQYITLDINPVCGCNGKEYINASSAIADGLTGWTIGPCNLIDGYWVNTQFNPTVSSMFISENNSIIELFTSLEDRDESWLPVRLNQKEDYYTAYYDLDYSQHDIEIHQSEHGLLKMIMTTRYWDKEEAEISVYFFERGEI